MPFSSCPKKTVSNPALEYYRCRHYQPPIVLQSLGHFDVLSSDGSPRWVSFALLTKSASSFQLHRITWPKWNLACIPRIFRRVGGNCRRTKVSFPNVRRTLPTTRDHFITVWLVPFLIKDRGAPKAFTTFDFLAKSSIGFVDF